VSQLLKEAKMTRSTFYHHFSSIDDACDQLVQDGLAPIELYLKDLLEELLSHSRDRSDEDYLQRSFEPLRGFFAYCKEHDYLYHGLLKTDLRDRFQLRFVRRFEYCLSGCLRAQQADTDRRDPFDDLGFCHKLLYRSVAFDLLSILETWMAEDFKQATELVAEAASLVTLPNPDLYSLEEDRADQRPS